MALQAQGTKEKRKIEIHQSCQVLCFKDTIKNVKRQLTEEEKICSNHISDKELVSTIYKELFLQVNTKRQTPV